MAKLKPNNVKFNRSVGTVPASYFNTGPTPIASDGGVDWYGETTSAELISGDALASMVGLTAGIPQYSDDGWLHVGLDGTEMYIAKKPFRYEVNWNTLSSLNLVYGQTVTINGQQYNLRLMKGANADPVTSDPYGYDHIHTHNSEWNRIFYRLTDETYAIPSNIKTSEEPFVHLATYTETDLVLVYTAGFGNMTLCQESVPSTGPHDCMVRGVVGVSHSRVMDKTVGTTDSAWRPVLEKL